MLVAFLGADGIIAPTYAALLAANGFSALGQTTRILSLGNESDSPILSAQRIANSIQEVESGSDIEVVLETASWEYDHVVLVSSVSRRSWVPMKECACIIVVEPTRAHELIALEVSQSMSPPASILRWGHADHSASIARAASTFDASPVKVLAVAIPTLNRRETDALTDGATNSRTDRIGLQLALALIAPSGDPGVGFDNRGIPDRLRELAADIEAIEDGAAPTEEDLLNAPNLTGWARLPQQVPVIAGVVAGHPQLDGFMITSQVFASDGRSWARTLSRWYRLGAPATSPSPPPIH
jgi:hypothetical protein